MYLPTIKCLHFHPGKTAGTSIEKILSKFEPELNGVLHVGGSSRATSKIHNHDKDEITVDDANFRKKYLVGILHRNHDENNVFATYLQHLDIELFLRFEKDVKDFLSSLLLGTHIQEYSQHSFTMELIIR